MSPLAIGLYATTGCLWLCGWAIGACIEHGNWAEWRDKKWRGDEEKSRRHRRNFLVASANAALAPIWPLPVSMYVAHAVRYIYREVRRAWDEEVAEAFDRRLERDIAEAVDRIKAEKAAQAKAKIPQDR